jgi:hypothetical protein
VEVEHVSNDRGLPVDHEIERSLTDKITRETRQDRNRATEFARKSSGHHRAALARCLSDEHPVGDARDQTIPRFKSKPPNRFLRCVRADENSAGVENRIHPISKIIGENSRKPTR